ncbi:MAG: hypothetical protein AAF434_13500 [Pseudomonadota bacterium]
MIIQPGTSIYCAHGGKGTVGALVRKSARSRKLYLLTAWHVLDNDRASGATEVRLGSARGKVIATYKPGNATRDEKLDVAIAELDKDIEDLEWTNKVRGSNKLLNKTASPTSRTKFQMYGATTKLSNCRLDQKFQAFGSIENAFLLKAAEGVDASTGFCASGDSGAMWYSQNSGRMIGLHSKGDMSGEVNGTMRTNCAAAVSITAIMNKLQIELATEVEAVT